MDDEIVTQVASSRVTVQVDDTTFAWQVPDAVAAQLVRSFTEVVGLGDGQPVSDVETLIEQLKDKQLSLCAYGAREGDGRTCDCKYLNPLIRSQIKLGGNTEVTGCCELRAAIQILEALDA